MKCSACGTETAISGKFCPNCGAAVLPDGPLNAMQPAAASSGKGGIIAVAAAAVVALAAGGGYMYYDKQQQEKKRIEAERVADEKRRVEIAERDKKLAEERAAREKEAAARAAAEKQAKLLAQQKAEADARARAAEDNAKKAAAVAAASKAPPPRPGVSTERSAPLIRNMVSAALAGDEPSVQRFRGNIEALPKPPAGDRVAAGAARQTAAEALKRGDAQTALERYQYAIAADPTDVASYSGLGNTYNRLGRYSDADAAFSRALTLAPASQGAWTNFGMALARSGNTDAAAGALVNAYVFSPDRTRAYDSLRRMANGRDANVQAAATRALQSRLVSGAR